MKIHFIGIGGIGVSALARYYLNQGAEISGSDLVESEITRELENLGVKIFIGKHKAKNLPKDTNLVIYSQAVQKNNPELIEASKKKIKILSYPEALGKLTKNHFTIAVCGTHGKSTTTALIGLILTKAGFDPTVILGTKLKEFKNSNCRIGKSKYLVIEADEHFASFLNYSPKIIVLTALDPDHLDYYKNFKNYLLGFKKFILTLPSDGVLVANYDDKKIRKLISTIKKPKFRIEKFNQKEKERKKLEKILKIPGRFNVSNSLAALKVAKILKIKSKIYFYVFKNYKGSWRRFEIKKIKIKGKNTTLISDYAHHPTEVEETLNAIKEKFKNKKIICVFQPHQYSRTFYLFEYFVEVFKKIKIEKIIITDIYDVPGREDINIKNKVSSQLLVEKIKNKNVIYVSQKRIFNFIKKSLKGGEVVVIMGAGDIYELWKKLSFTF